MLVFFLVIITCSVLSVYFRIGVPIETEWNEEHQIYRWLGYPPAIHKTAVVVTLLICFFVSISSLLINIYSFVSWRKYREAMTPKMRATQKSLFYFSVLSFFCSFLICWQQLSANLIKFQGNQAFANVIFDLYFPISTFAIFVEPYAIIFFSSALRKEVARTFGREEGSSSGVFTLQRPT
ncbi:hypothetical protein Y032_0025g1224 [Ancylostoma ceylanicum]|uniref:Serpentine receptor class gamma n=1 Tax=Ancylostoma ceylanicum TaxID=53326 RepID=A0A016UWQ1_9BILA|nr:hypothetical protein Y032_0025g1224 [Ancylostoma ceylanicum]